MKLITIGESVVTLSADAFAYTLFHNKVDLLSRKENETDTVDDTRATNTSRPFVFAIAFVDRKMKKTDVDLELPKMFEFVSKYLPSFLMSL